MEPTSYLQRLTERLADGLSRLEPATRQRHTEYLLRAQNPDGGFSGREGGSDLYYTGFALRGLAVLEALSPEVCERAAGFLRGRLTGQTGVVDFYSLLYSCGLVQLMGGIDVLGDAPTDWPDRVAATLETFRTPEGGYAKAPGHPGASTYHSFLVALCYELLARPVPRPEETAAFVLSRRRADGGFVEIRPMRRSGANPTAAAVGLLQVLEGQGQGGVLTDEVRAGVVGLLVSLASDEGGVRANGKIPAADLLSTFTAAWTLHQLGALDRLDRAAVGRYARGNEGADGGFRGGWWDEGRDVEYTFYGLGVLALLA
jgi:geranylgeranyl transferase type-2 subunit beta